MDSRIASSTEHTRLFLPLACFFKPDHQSASHEHTTAESIEDILMNRETQEKILEDIRYRRLSEQGQQQTESLVQLQDEVEGSPNNSRQAPGQTGQQSHDTDFGRHVVETSNATQNGASINGTDKVLQLSHLIFHPEISSGCDSAGVSRIGAC